MILPGWQASGPIPLGLPLPSWVQCIHIYRSKTKLPKRSLSFRVSFGAFIIQFQFLLGPLQLIQHSRLCSFSFMATQQNYNSSRNMEKSRNPNLSDPETPTSLSQDGHISLASSSSSSPSPSRSNHGSSGQLKPPPTTLQARLQEESPARSSISSDRCSLSNESFPSPIREEEKVPPSLPENPPEKFLDNHPAPVAVVSHQFVSDEPPVLSKNIDPPRREDGRVEEGGGRRGSGRKSRPALSILKRTEREQMVKKAALGFRVFGFIFSLVSFSVMAADRNKGWALDSFDRYIEFRYFVKFLNLTDGKLCS